MDVFNQFLDGKPYKGFTELEIGVYEIVRFRFIRNKFYDPDVANSPRKTLVAELHDQILFLPSYMAANFQNDEKLLESINNDGVKRFLHFGGQRDNK